MRHSPANREEKEIKQILIGKEVKLSLFAEDMIPYTETSKDATRKLLVLINELKLQDIKLIHRNSLYFYTLNNENSHLFQNFPQFIVIHTVKGFGIVNKAEIDVFLELSCFFDDPAHVGNLISGFSALSKTSLNIWKFAVHVLLKPSLENFEHYFTSM